MLFPSEMKIDVRKISIMLYVQRREIIAKILTEKVIRVPNQDPMFEICASILTKKIVWAPNQDPTLQREK